MERRPGPAEVGPLRHRLEVIDRFGGLDLDRSHQLLAPIDGRQHQVGKNLHLADAHRNRLILADIRHDVVLALELDLQETDDTVVLELFANRPDQNWAHFASAPDSTLNQAFMKTGNLLARLPNCVDAGTSPKGPALDVQPTQAENDTVIAPAEPRLSEAATRTILIVDDDRSVADTFARMLKLEGFGVVTALSADAGLAMAKTSPPDAIILDMRMPITNGLQFLRQVRVSSHAWSSVPVAIVTGDYFLTSPRSTSCSRSARRSASSRCGSRT